MTLAAPPKAEQLLLQAIAVLGVEEGWQGRQRCDCALKFFFRVGRASTSFNRQSHNGIWREEFGNEGPPEAEAVVLRPASLSVSILEQPRHRSQGEHRSLRQGFGPAIGAAACEVGGGSGQRVVHMDDI
eukprot:CAMPEP_0117671956 /NCGR_PEP_ID=MMETSP0804-20121206/13637_1 /TAXON_ID=1074897 /ORGANISM="Tetraselmis astigmatica, Strain CCMP880" /LENGTH=128 /DNA_ID=CAMNT_0005480505 /DNA_START=985 /DNA_END=1372 /DNA_ORIENTATION=+